MFLNYLKIALRTFARQKLYAFINIFGLSLGIACCVLILLYVQQELRYDKFNTQAGSLYRMLTVEHKANGETDMEAYQPMPFVTTIKAEVPELEHAAHFVSGGVILASQDKAFSQRVIFTDPDLFRMFDIQFIGGSPLTALHDPSEIVITEEIADKYFGTADVLGRTLTMKSRAGEFAFTITGVVKKMPAASTLQFDVLADITRHSNYKFAGQRWTSSNGSAFVQLAQGATQSIVEKQLASILVRNLGDNIHRRQEFGRLAKIENPIEIQLQPLADIRLDTRVQSSPEEIGSPSSILILSGIALLVLAIACINFVTLAVARSAQRAREVGMRKVVGSTRRQLILQFWGEALILTIAAIGIGLVLAELFLPTFNVLSGKTLELQPLSDAGLMASLVALLVVVSLAAGGYPALVVSRFQPSGVLKGRVRLGGKNFFTKALVIFQFGLSIFLVCSALVLAEQTRFLINKKLGFQPEQIVVLSTFAPNSETAEQLVERLRTSLRGKPGFLKISATSGAFTHGYDIEGFRYNGESKSTFVYRVDEEYFETLGITLQEGRNFVHGSAADRDHAMVVNEAFLRSVGWTKPAVGKRLIGVEDEVLAKLEVIGVVPDFHFTSLEKEIRPLVMFTSNAWPLDNILVRISPENIPGSVEELRKTWAEIAPGLPFDMSFLDEDFRKLYERETSWGRIVTTASVFAVVLAALGLLGLAALSAANRTKEIGIRKVLGSSAAALVGLLSREFLLLVVAANVIAWPIAYFAASKYLEIYAYRISISWMTFAAAGVVALSIAFLAIAGQVFRAARANPVESLRYE